ncbi:MAG: DUF350 domain-containing protein [Candidatus Diapherotrites archaeon]|uniref:DUF350 domain-containing protein n=1 Tax=Candidatus Iainarchaeum sp. TaxID=3101447 RepID=A0A8T4L364_9ARCH|nr:DUF350 domain-containing protein [Candidatus Diapherotrites archaeon]
MPILIDDVIGAVVYTLLGGVLGLLLLLLAVLVVPRILYALSPKIDEEKEIARGNMAVAHYYGAIVQGVLIGFALIIAAAIISGIHGW